MHFMDLFIGSNKWFNKAQTRIADCYSYSNSNINDVVVYYIRYNC